MRQVKENIKLGLKLAEKFREKYVSKDTIGIKINDAVEKFSKDIGIDIKLMTSDLTAISKRENNEISGVMINKDGLIKIFVHEKDSPTRQRFTIAHELGHIYKDVDEGKDLKISSVSYRMANCEGEAFINEQLINAFASELLMPTEQVKFFVETNYSLYEIANKFGVSYLAMLNKVKTI
jgi:Zn-dependent peptidase ImmA (M78 family)